tara:strand:+ start:2409 stop:2858 length:450 start_codon:yes stop_codon:yes gene_type:complete
MNILCSNKKSTYRYTILKKIEAGLVLEGWEVKSLKSGHGQISESYVSIKDNEAFLINSHIKVIQTVSENKVTNSTRSRKLLLNKKELNSLIGEIKLNGYTLIPIKVYTKKALIKIEIAVAKGKKTYDKRADIKKREWDRQKSRILKKNS